MYFLLIIVLILTGYYGFTDKEFFDTQFAREDGAIEYATFFLLLAISLVQFFRLLTRGKGKPILWKLAVLFFGLLFLFGAGEEISWGQRIFNIESSEFFKGNNVQKETNFHNLKIGDIKLNHLIFSQLLTIVMVLYLLATPILYKRSQFFKRLLNRFVIPIPRLNHIIAFAINTGFIAILPQLGKKWEVYELFFAGIFLLIFLNPVNKHLYLRETSR